MPRLPNTGPARPAAPVKTAVPTVFDVWGKSRDLDGTYPLVCHLVDAGLAAEVLFDARVPAHAAQRLADGIGVDVADVRTFVMLVAAWHDLGKCAPAWQSQDAEAFAASGADACSFVQGEQLRHEHMSQLHVADWLRRHDLATALSETLFGQGTSGHHGTFYPTTHKRQAAESRRVMHGDYVSSTDWRDLRDTIMRTVAGVVLPGVDVEAAIGRLNDCEMSASLRVLCALATHVTVVADWVVSCTETFIDTTTAPRDMSALDDWVATQRVRIKTRADRFGLTPPPLVPGPLADLIQVDGPFAPRGVQVPATGILETLGPGLVILLDQAGIGKTEAAWHVGRTMGADLGLPGVMFCLPTRDTTTAMFGRGIDMAAVSFDEPTRVNLMHSQAYTHQVYTDMRRRNGDGKSPSGTIKAVTDWVAGHRKGLLAPVSFGTVDQALVTTIGTKWQPLGLFGILGRVLAVDEVHDYDPHMQELLLTLLNWAAAFGTPTVFASATTPSGYVNGYIDTYRRGLPPHCRTDLNPVPDLEYPGWVHVSQDTGRVTLGAAPVSDSHARSTRFVLRPYPAEQWRETSNLVAAVKDALAPILDGGDGTAVVFCNDVRSANRVYGHLRMEMGDESVELLHGALQNKFRNEISEDHVAKMGKRKEGAPPRPKRHVLVATQIAQQSLDVNFDIVVTMLAPSGVMVQREGRQYRHVLPERPAWSSGSTVVVLAPFSGDELDPPDRAPYDRAELDAAWLWLEAHADGDELFLDVPGDVQRFVDDTYDFVRDASLIDPADVASAAARRQRGAAAGVEKAIPYVEELSCMETLTGLPVDADDSVRFDMDSHAILPVVARGQRWEVLGSGGRLMPLKRGRRNVRFVNDFCANRPLGRGLREIVDASNALKPAAWADDSTLERVVIVPFEPTGQDGVYIAQYASKWVTYSRELGVFLDAPF